MSTNNEHKQVMLKGKVTVKGDMGGRDELDQQLHQELGKRKGKMKTLAMENDHNEEL